MIDDAATRSQLLQTWITLAALSALSTALHLSGFPAQVSGGLILIFAWIKARLILLDYLELRVAPGWAAGLLLSLAGFISLLAILFLSAD